LLSKNGRIKDSLGRDVILRGVNLSGMENGTTGIFNEEDFTALKNSGFNAIRLPLGWKGFEPSKGEWNEGYAGDLDRILGLAEKRAIYVLPDLHQWFWSMAGMPEWTCDIKPVLTTDYLLGCSKQFFSSPEMTKAFKEVWLNLAARYKGQAVIAGFDIMNEPPPTSVEDYLNGKFESEILYGFYGDIIEGIRSADPGRTIFIEPAIVSYGPTAFPAFPFDNIVYAPHIYVPHNYEEGVGLVWLFEPNAEFLKQQYESAMKEAVKLDTALVIGEYGVAPEKEGLGGWLLTSSAIQDANLIGSFYWDFKGGGWSLFPENLALKPFFLEHLIRPYIAAAAGEILEMTSVPWSGRLNASIHVPSGMECVATEIILPPVLYQGEPEIFVSENAEYLYMTKTGRLLVRTAHPDTIITIEIK
ncbi:MAG: cellulase family glycosylhydrolase, partial [Deltaproteobacteria bacterium]|nr:cellulase family glycosylhydrolase [Deltaproteobacteria bacterium]